MRDRIRPPADLEPLLDRLKDKGVFKTKQKGMMFAAALGYAIRLTNPDGKKLTGMGGGIRLEYFQKPRDEGFIDALAVAYSGELEILAEERKDERLDIFERFAHSGLVEMQRRCELSKDSDLHVVCELISELGGFGISEDTDGKIRRLQGLV